MREEGSLSREILDNMAQLMMAAFGLVAALAWNAAIQALFEALLPGAGDLAAKFLYAVIVTVAVVLVTVRLGRLSERLKREEAEEEA
jgi:hypothetical protein